MLPTVEEGRYRYGMGGEEDYGSIGSIWTDDFKNTHFLALFTEKARNSSISVTMSILNT